MTNGRRFPNRSSDQLISKQIAWNRLLDRTRRHYRYWTLAAKLCHSPRDLIKAFAGNLGRGLPNSRICQKVPPMALLSEIFTWWNGQTIGTRFMTWRKGEKVGTDSQGNIYYRGKRRWVIYNGLVEASRIPPEWHGWLHYTVDTAPSEVPPKVKPWEKEHVPNLTGTVLAYAPPGSVTGTGQRAKATGDYEAWKPE
jgi:NADH:ubiquinone oxidoreductase subunit